MMRLPNARRPVLQQLNPTELDAVAGGMGIHAVARYTAQSKPFQESELLAPRFAPEPGFGHSVAQLGNRPPPMMAPPQENPLAQVQQGFGLAQQAMNMFRSLGGGGQQGAAQQGGGQPGGSQGGDPGGGGQQPGGSGEQYGDPFGDPYGGGGFDGGF